MNVFILTLGTRGDLELFLSLGSELKRRGHGVVLGSSPFNEARTRAAGIEWQCVGDSTLAQVQDTLRSLASVDDKATRTRLYYKRWLQPELTNHSARIAALAARCDVFISNLKLRLERAGRAMPTVFVDYDVPASPTDPARFGTSSKAHRRSTLDLVAMNRALIDPHDEWPPQFEFTGFWHALPGAAWKPPCDLLEFMDAGPPPVVLTMGSMAMADSENAFKTLAQALDLCDARAVVVAGWSNVLANQSHAMRIFTLAEIPYNWLFPKSACVIHHGGSGTTANVLSAGIPSVVVPQISCQTALARILERENLATAVIDERSLTPARLSVAIASALRDPIYKSSAKRWQLRIESDSGTPQAVDLIEKHWRSLS